MAFLRMYQNKKQVTFTANATWNVTNVSTHLEDSNVKIGLFQLEVNIHTVHTALSPLAGVRPVGSAGHPTGLDTFLSVYGRDNGSGIEANPYFLMPCPINGSGNVEIYGRNGQNGVEPRIYLVGELFGDDVVAFSDYNFVTPTANNTWETQNKTPQVALQGDSGNVEAFILWARQTTSDAEIGFRRSGSTEDFRPNHETQPQVSMHIVGLDVFNQYQHYSNLLVDKSGNTARYYIAEVGYIRRNAGLTLIDNPSDENFAPNAGFLTNSVSDVVGFRASQALVRMYNSDHTFSAFRNDWDGYVRDSGSTNPTRGVFPGSVNNSFVNLTSMNLEHQYNVEVTDVNGFITGYIEDQKEAISLAPSMMLNSEIQLNKNIKIPRRR